MHAAVSILNDTITTTSSAIGQHVEKASTSQRSDVVAVPAPMTVDTGFHNDISASTLLQTALDRGSFCTLASGSTFDETNSTHVRA